MYNNYDLTLQPLENSIKNLPSKNHFNSNFCRIITVVLFFCPILACCCFFIKDTDDLALQISHTLGILTLSV